MSHDLNVKGFRICPEDEGPEEFEGTLEGLQQAIKVLADKSHSPLHHIQAFGNDNFQFFKIGQVGGKIQMSSMTLQPKPDAPQPGGTP